jgi:hypothetical protein
VCGSHLRLRTPGADSRKMEGREIQCDVRVTAARDTFIPKPFDESSFVDVTDQGSPMSNDAG